MLIIGNKPHIFTVIGTNNIVLTRTCCESLITLAVFTHAVKVIIGIDRMRIMVFSRL